MRAWAQQGGDSNVDRRRANAVATSHPCAMYGGHSMTQWRAGIHAKALRIARVKRADERTARAPGSDGNDSAMVFAAPCANPKRHAALDPAPAAALLDLPMFEPTCVAADGVAQEASSATARTEMCARFHASPHIAIGGHFPRYCSHASRNVVKSTQFPRWHFRAGR